MSNCGFMGNAVMLDVFGSDRLFDYSIFTMPMNAVIYTRGIAHLTPLKGGA